MEPTKDFLKKLSQEMANNPDIMTFSDIAKAAASGAAAGHKAQIPGGALSGAMLGVSLEAGERSARIAKKLFADG